MFGPQRTKATWGSVWLRAHFSSQHFPSPAQTRWEQQMGWGLQRFGVLGSSSWETDPISGNAIIVGDPWQLTPVGQWESLRGPGHFAHPDAVKPPQKLPRSTGRLGGAHPARGKRATRPGFRFAFKMHVGGNCQTHSPNNSSSYGKPFFHCPGWLPTAQATCQDALLKPESSFHALRAARRAPKPAAF